MKLAQPCKSATLFKKKVALGTEKLNFSFYFILINLRLLQPRVAGGFQVGRAGSEACSSQLERACG